MSGHRCRAGIAAVAGVMLAAPAPHPLKRPRGQTQPIVQRWNGTAFTSDAVPQQQIDGLLYAVAATAGPTVFGAGTRWDLNGAGSLSDRTLSMRGSGS